MAQNPREKKIIEIRNHIYIFIYISKQRQNNTKYITITLHFLVRSESRVMGDPFENFEGSVLWHWMAEI